MPPEMPWVRGRARRGKNDPDRAPRREGRAVAAASAAGQVMFHFCHYSTLVMEPPSSRWSWNHYTRHNVHTENADAAKTANLARGDFDLAAAAGPDHGAGGGVLPHFVTPNMELLVGDQECGQDTFSPRGNFWFRSTLFPSRRRPRTLIIITSPFLFDAAVISRFSQMLLED